MRGPAGPRSRGLKGRSRLQHLSPKRAQRWALQLHSSRADARPPAAASAPEEGLELEWVHGYQGVRNTSPNLFFTARGELVWYIAGVGVVYDPSTHRQRHFLGHSDDISSLAIHPGRQLVATGQVGFVPSVCVWDSATCQAVARLDFAEGDRGITALAFNARGDKVSTPMDPGPVSSGLALRGAAA